MSLKQKLVLVVLLLMALVPLFTGGKKKHSQRETNSQSATVSGSLGLIAEADAALVKLAELESVPPREEPSVDSMLQGRQMAEVPAEPPAFEATPEPIYTPEQIAEVTTTTLAFPVETPEPRQTPAAVSAEEARQVGWELTKMRSQLRDVQNDFKKRETELVTQLGVAQDENLKLSHQLQALERKSAQVDKSEKRQRDLQDEIKKLEERLDAQAKLNLSRKTERADFERKINEDEKLRKSLEQQLAKSVKENESGARERENLRGAVSDFEQRIKILEEQRLAESEEKDKVLMKQISAIQKDLSAAMSAADESRKKNKSFSAEVEALKVKLEQANKQLQDRQKEADEFAVKLAASERQVEQTRGVQQELLRAQNELLVAREQVNALRNTSRSAGPYQPQTYPERTYTSPQIDAIPPPPIERVPPRSLNQNDYVTVEVTAPKVVLRAGPGEEHSPIMEIQRGSQLVVETREGSWLRVITPKGNRAYLRSDLAAEVNAASGRPRYAAPVPTRSPPAVPTRPVEKTPPSADPLADIVGSKRSPAVSPSADDPAPSPAPNEEEEKSAFEAIKNLKRE